jgi:hypothetical protein
VNIQRIIRYTFGICGIVLFVYLVRRVGVARIADSAQQIGWGTLAIIAIGGAIFLVRSVAWRCALGRECRELPIRVLFRIYVSAEATGFLFFGGPAVADTTRVLLLRGSVPTDRVIASVTLDRGLYLVGSAILLAATIFLLPLTLHHGTAAPRYVYIVGSIYSAIFGALWIAMRRRVRLLTGLFDIFSKFRPVRSWTERWRAGAVQVETTMFHFLDTDRPKFWSAFGLNLAAHLLAVFELWVILWLLGLTASPLTALLIEGMNKIANISGIMVPANVGAHEAANMMILKLVGFDPAVGLILALARDVRRIFWVGIGLTLFLTSGRRHLPQPVQPQ